MTEKNWPQMGGEAGMRHLREIIDLRHDQAEKKFGELDERNRVQDREMERLGAQLGGEIKAIRNELWLGIKWAAGLLFVTLLSVVLKAQGLI